MKIYLKCNYCHHAVGQELDLRNRGRHSTQDEGQVWVGVSSSLFHHHQYNYQIGPMARGEVVPIYHEACKETYAFWSSNFFQHRGFCHLEDCPHSPPYPFARFSLPFSGTPTKLGNPIPIPEEVHKLLRL